MAFYTNPGWSNLTPPPVSEQNLNDMSNALEKTAYVENGKLYDNNNNLIDIGNARITLGSYVGNGTNRISFNAGPNQKIFMMFSDTAGNNIPGGSVFGTANNVTYWGSFFIVQIAFLGSDARVPVSVVGQHGSGYQTLYVRYNGSTIRMESSYMVYNTSGRTYHYATIGV